VAESHTASQKLSWPCGLCKTFFHHIPPAHGQPPGANIPRKHVTGKEMSAVPVPMFEGPLWVQVPPDTALSAQAAKLCEPGFSRWGWGGITKASIYFYFPKKTHQQFCSKKSGQGKLFLTSGRPLDPSQPLKTPSRAAPTSWRCLSWSQSLRQRALHSSNSRTLLYLQWWSKSSGGGR
jgi:hypothetical protein